MSHLAVTFKQIEGAATFEKLLDGRLPDKAYHDYARAIHPDVVPASLRTRAEEAFKRLTELYSAFRGDRKTVQVGPYTVAGALAKGDICDVYRVTAPTAAVLKIARSPADQDLLMREERALRLLHDPKDSNHYQRYIPKLLDSFGASGRRANVIEYCEGFRPLYEILGYFPKGIEFRHIVWMMNRALSALGYVHYSKVVHGAITPDHLLYDAASHDLRLVDWCYASTQDECVPARIKRWASLYPPEVMRKEKPTPGTDLYLLAKSMLACAPSVPSRFRGIFELLTADSPRSRPQDAWEVSERWKTLAEFEYGPPKYVPLTIPVH